VAAKREEADDLALLDGDEAFLRPHGAGALGAPALVAEVVRQAQHDGVARLGVGLSEPPDHTSSISWTSSAQDVSGSSWHAAARSSSQMAAKAR
jgi:hypothetical protein